MNDFVEALVSDGKSPNLPDEYNYFGKLIGSWKLDYIDHNLSSSVKGEWIFSWVLEGMGIQDVIILPARDARTDVVHPLTEYGTSLRVYNPTTHAWDVAYGFTGKIFRLEAKKQGDMIVLTNLEDENHKWVFATIEDDRFHWQNVTVQANGDWHINADIYAKRA
ncbi:MULTISPECIES: hypothetical protein [Gordonibacter]|uniref:DUF1579 domain-containing protein n=1 Tax=Gordonibacter faecis TaxID=3047475 RepID=A0ABT7DQI6_9ACTN|nr:MULTISPECIES: hypothetical protein [unclassified Gordonibacter]MDJ1651793.1 hypothetical protein [Gordonibacter sp. KGMB12511]HIW75674.1 hypothetical protein [Candidatus Gordonibacter avicola]